jgi:hypothetical protein
MAKVMAMIRVMVMVDACQWEAVKMEVMKARLMVMMAGGLR